MDLSMPPPPLREGAAQPPKAAAVGVGMDAAWFFGRKTSAASVARSATPFCSSAKEARSTAFAQLLRSALRRRRLFPGKIKNAVVITTTI